MAVKWLTLPQPLLGDRIPAEMMVTIEGAREVEAMIARVTEGAFS